MPGQQHRIRRQNSSLILHGSLLAGVGTAQDLLDLQHGRGLHDVLHPGWIVDTG
jgi:hypothetical protein